jgi:hypothetical protein
MEGYLEERKEWIVMVLKAKYVMARDQLRVRHVTLK